MVFDKRCSWWIKGGKCEFSSSETGSVGHRAVFLWNEDCVLSWSSCHKMTKKRQGCRKR